MADEGKADGKQIEDDGFYREEEAVGGADADNDYDFAPVSWTASEYVAHEKGAGWYLLLILVTAVAAGLVYLVTDDMFSTVVVAVIGVVFGVFAARKPQTLEYTLDDNGIHIGSKIYSYREFKSFSEHEDGAIIAITFMPLKRFATLLTIYTPPEMEDRILDTLSNFLPHETGNPDQIDRLMRRLRF